MIERFGQTDAIQLLSEFKIDDAAMMRTNLMVLTIAIAVSVIGSGLAVTRYLDKDR